MSSEAAAQVLASRDRALCPATAVAHGLYLGGIYYPPAFALPLASGEGTRADGCAMIPGTPANR